MINVNPYVKLFQENNVESLEEAMNDWIEENNQVVIDKMYIQPISQFNSSMSGGSYSASPLYFGRIEYIGKRVKPIKLTKEELVEKLNTWV